MSVRNDDGYANTVTVCRTICACEYPQLQKVLARFRCLPHTLKSSTVYNGGNEHGWTSGRCSICTPLCNPSPTDWGVNAASCASTILLKGRILHTHVPVISFRYIKPKKSWAWECLGSPGVPGHPMRVNPPRRGTPAPSASGRGFWTSIRLQARRVHGDIGEINPKPRAGEAGTPQMNTVILSDSPIAFWRQAWDVAFLNCRKSMSVF